jgi:hypothetical protein
MFPCQPGGCSGSFTGTATGQLENTGANGSGPISAFFTYQENNCEHGFAIGSGTINGVSFTFSWYRMGNIARIIGRYGPLPHFINGVTAFAVTSPTAPTMCVPGASPAAVTARVAGVAAGV